jgi:hypothetical protein
MRKLPWAAFTLLVGTVGLMNVFAGCGSESDDTIPPVADGGDGSTDGNTATDDGASSDDGGVNLPDASYNDAPTCKVVGQGCGTSTDCCSANCNATTKTCGAPINGCKLPAAACSSPNECCTGSCVNGACSDKQCVPDKPTAGVCGVAGDCCSGICTNHRCASVNPGQTCRTSGNPCGNASECCSNLCNNGVCSSAVSFCTQQGEVCSTNFECCGGNCVKQGTNTTGACGAPTSGGGVPSGCSPSGTVCGVADPANDGGALPCDQACCSRSCGYFGASAGFRVCQPPSGCRPTGEVCRADSDCCGWTGGPQPADGFVHCSKATPTSEFGRCDNGGSCREPGSICKPGDGDSCSAENNCCEHSSLPQGYCNTKATQENCCNKDALGIPRCLIKPVNCNTPPPAGTVCATSADCCGNPCVNNKCGAANSCVGTGGACTASSDCCPGIPCTQPPGSTKGICGGTLTSDGGVADAGSGVDAGSNLPDGGTCSLYGQLCASSAGCCNNVPCTAGRCRYP